MSDKKLQRLVIMEGPDCAGKTSLTHDFRRLTGMETKVVHHGPYTNVSADQLPRFYVESMFGLFQGDAVIMDRCWLSEPIYGDAFRGGQSRITDNERRQLERMALRHGAVVVLCLPPWERVKAEWLKRKNVDNEAEYLDRIDQLEQVYKGYEQLEAETDLPVVRYDYTRHSSQVDQLVRHVSRISTGIHPTDYLRTAGSAHPKVILVGDQPSEPTSRDTTWQFPFCSFGAGSSLWLTHHLAEAGIREQDLFWINSSGGLHTLKSMWSVPIVALGKDAAEKIRTDLGRDPDLLVDHPQHHRRFKSKDVYPLGQALLGLIK